MERGIVLILLSQKPEVISLGLIMSWSSSSKVHQIGHITSLIVEKKSLKPLIVLYS